MGISDGTRPEYDFSQVGQWRILKVHSNRLDEQLAYFRREGLNGLMLSRYTGFESTDISFLAEQPDVKAVILPDASHYDLSVLYSLPALEYLGFSGSRQQFELARCPSIVTASFEWHPGIAIDERCATLRTLAISRYKPPSRDLTELPTLPQLDGLALIDSRTLTTLDGIDRFSRLSRIELSYLSRLSHIEPIKGLAEGMLATLECLKCPAIKDYEVIEYLRSLTTLRINECSPIANLAFLKQLCRLRDFRIVGTDVRDGDLSVLLTMDTIESFACTNKRHFYPTQKQISAHIAARRHV